MALLGEASQQIRATRVLQPGVEDTSDSPSDFPTYIPSDMPSDAPSMMPSAASEGSTGTDGTVPPEGGPGGPDSVVSGAYASGLGLTLASIAFVAFL